MPTENGSNRRQFFSALAAAASTAAATASIPAPALAQEVVDSPAVAPMVDRLQRSHDMAVKLADARLAMTPVDHPTNGDEERYPNKIASFSKTLLHKPNGETSLDAYRSLIKAVQSGLYEDFERILRGGNVRLKNPTGAYNFQFDGPDGSQYTMPAAPAFSSATHAAEMMELYWQALTRDVPFADYASNPLINEAANELSTAQGYLGPKAEGRVTPANLFRNGIPGSVGGPYLSQFLARPFRMGSIEVEPRQKPAAANLDFMLAYSEWFGIQLGEGKGPGNQYEDNLLFIRNGRDLTTFVHYDSGWSPYYHALWILLGFGADAYMENNPYTKAKGQEPYINFGTPDSLDILGRAAKPAFNAAWFQKWFVHLRARPEAVGARIYQNAIGNEAYPLHEQVMNSRALASTFSKFGTYLLPQAYSEGSPAHSSYPSGHATVAGCCATMLKAFFNENYVIPDPVVPSADGAKLLKYEGPELTVGGELNKMAFNIAMARNWAGIHFRSDAMDGMHLGEEVAMQVLASRAMTYLDDFEGFSFTRFNGEKVTIKKSVS
ncbi:MAG: vanadium-dependent haloperoxidase [Bryobacteraceae bacterium]